MDTMNLTINGISVEAKAGETILQAARRAGVEIPTLCHDERVKTYGACGLCVVEAADTPKLLRACSTAAADGMEITTDSERIRASRKTALEFLLSDHTGDCRPPCALACPAGTDCQGYVGLIANGEFQQALKVAKDVNPFPASIGRVCPHPCETACRRKHVEEPISIAWLKRFVADKDIAQAPYVPQQAPPTGKKVAVVGGGPGGLSSAYFLAVKGHDVTVYDAMPEMGGMLRYGIPAYRLPKDVLDREIDIVARLGVKLVNNRRLGQDFTLEELRRDNDAVIIATGAWVSRGMRVPGEELDCVVGGIDFLRTVALGEPMDIGRKVVVVGGGNTAMDACRTAVRLGAEEVSIVYRRTRSEMPADDVEIKEAEEEGVVFRYLTNPLEFREGSVLLQKMELGEMDASGRRSPVPIEGAVEEIACDTVMMAIGQGSELSGLEELESTRRSTIAADESTFMTSMEGVFAIGDVTNKGASIAIEAIGEAHKSAPVIDSYLRGETVGYRRAYVVELPEPPFEKLKQYSPVKRPKMWHLLPEYRRENFEEVVLGYSDEAAVQDAQRCLECGCQDYFECRLYHYSNQYGVEPERLAGEKHSRTVSDTHPYITRDPDKCILCGLCVRVCDEAMGVTALGLVDRGFDTIVKPALDQPLTETACVSCGMCAAICPTGALGERSMYKKDVPVKEESEIVTCAFCPAGCKVDLRTAGGMVTRALPVDGGFLCAVGRYGIVNQRNGGVKGDFFIQNTEAFTPIDEDIVARLVSGLDAKQVLKGLAIVNRKQK